MYTIGIQKKVKMTFVMSLFLNQVNCVHFLHASKTNSNSWQNFKTMSIDDFNTLWILCKHMYVFG